MHGDFKISVLAKGRQEQWHAATTFRRLSQGTINFAGCDDGFAIGRTHPVNCGVDVAIRDFLAMANDHGSYLVGLVAGLFCAVGREPEGPKLRPSD